MGTQPPPKLRVSCNYPDNVDRDLDLVRIDREFEIRPFPEIPHDERRIVYGPNEALPYVVGTTPRRQPVITKWIENHPLRAVLGKKAFRDFDENIARFIQIDGADRVLDGSFSGSAFWKYLERKKIRKAAPEWQDWGLRLSGAYKAFCREEIIVPPEKPPRVDVPLEPSRPISLSPFDYLSQYFSCWGRTSSLFLVGALALFALVRFQRRLPFELVGVLEKHSTGEKLTRVLGRLRRKEVNRLIEITLWIDAKPARIEGRQLIMEMPHYREIRRELWYRLDQAIFRGERGEAARWQRGLFEIDRFFRPGISQGNPGAAAGGLLSEPGWAPAAGKVFGASSDRRLFEKIAVVNQEGETLTASISFQSLRSPTSREEALRIIGRRLVIAEETWARERAVYSTDMGNDFAFLIEPDGLRIFDSGRRIRVTGRDEALREIRRLCQSADEAGVGYARSNLDSSERHRALLAMVHRFGDPWDLFQLPLLNGTYRIPSSFQLMIEEVLKRQPPRDRVASIELRQVLLDLWESYLNRQTGQYSPAEILKAMTDWAVQVPEPFL